MATEKQKKAVNLTLKNLDRDVPLNKGEILKQAGYGEVIQSQPKEVFESKGFLELFNKELPNDFLTKKHKQLLNKQEVIVKNNNKTGKLEVIPTGQIDVAAVGKGLDMAYKLKGSYSPDKHLNINAQIETKSDIDLDKITEEVAKKLKEEKIK